MENIRRLILRGLSVGLLLALAACRATPPGRFETAVVTQVKRSITIGGRRLHELAREGVEVEREARRVTVHRLDVTPAGEGVYHLSVDCSSGTYIRTLAADIGTALGGGAHLANLRRTAIGSFTLGDATALAELGEEHVLAPAEALRDYPAVTVTEDVTADVRHGKASLSYE